VSSTIVRFVPMARKRHTPMWWSSQPRPHLALCPHNSFRADEQLAGFCGTQKHAISTSRTTRIWSWKESKMQRNCLAAQNVT